MTQLRLYDTYAREKRVFVPGEPDRITMYVCGPTVYSRAHIGNARPAVVFDVLARLLRHLYPERRVVHAANITDVEDKIMAAAAAEGVPIGTITDRYSRFYFDDLAALGVPRPDLVPLATDHIGEMIAMIARLIAAGYAYVADGHALFDVPSWPDYGRLSRRPMDEMIAGARVEVAPYKRSPADFVLWKPSAPDQSGWDSPWGRGRPGWHIECSAMIAAHLGETIDIHGGGLDLEFPHHENEIAQSTCAHSGAPLARYWLHNGMLSIGSDKMSKSIGNVATIDALLAAGHRGETLRLALLSAHYRQPLEWSDALIAQSKARLDRWYRALATVTAAQKGGSAEQLGGFIDALADDLNTPKALAVIDSSARVIDRPDPSATYETGQLAYGPGSGARILAAVVAAAKFLGFLQASPEEWFQGSLGQDPVINAAIFARNDARHRRDFAEADRIRTALSANGILLEDTPAGTTWRRA